MEWRHQDRILSSSSTGLSLEMNIGGWQQAILNRAYTLANAALLQYTMKQYNCMLGLYQAELTNTVISTITHDSLLHLMEEVIACRRWVFKRNGSIHTGRPNPVKSQADHWSPQLSRNQCNDITQFTTLVECITLSSLIIGKEKQLLPWTENEWLTEASVGTGNPCVSHTNTYTIAEWWEKTNRVCSNATMISTQYSHTLADICTLMLLRYTVLQ